MDSTGSRSSWTASSATIERDGERHPLRRRRPAAVGGGQGRRLGALRARVRDQHPRHRRRRGADERQRLRRPAGAGARVGRGRTAGGAERRAPGAARLRLPAARTSAPGEVVSRAAFRLAPGDPEEIRATLAPMRGRRREAQPSGIKTFGSTFKNPEDERAEGRSAGQLLEAAGCRGLSHGGARFSEKHANFVENRGDATHRRRAGADGGGPPPRARALRGRAGAGGPGAGRGRAGPAAGSCEAADRSRAGRGPRRDRASASSPSACSATRPSEPRVARPAAGGDDRQRRAKRSRSAANGAIVRWLPLPRGTAAAAAAADRGAERRQAEGPVLEQALVLGAAPAALRPYVASSRYGESGVDVELDLGDRTALRRRDSRPKRSGRRRRRYSPIPRSKSLDYVNVARAHAPIDRRLWAYASARSLNPRPKSEPGQTLKS